MRSAWRHRPLQQCLCLVEGWGVAHRGEQLSSFAQRPISSGRVEGNQAAPLAEQRVGELGYVAKLAPLCGRGRWLQNGLMAREVSALMWPTATSRARHSRPTGYEAWGRFPGPMLC